jgi:low affinity Fe/Cu permease
LASARSLRAFGCSAFEHPETGTAGLKGAFLIRAGTLIPTRCQRERGLPAPHGRSSNMNETFSRIATISSQWLGKPISFIVSGLLIIIWAVSGPFFHYSDTWQLIVNTATTVLTFLAVFLIQNSQNRDGMAIQAKLDELISASRQARNDLVRAEEKTEDEIEQLRVDKSFNI